MTKSIPLKIFTLLAKKIMPLKPTTPRYPSPATTQILKASWHHEIAKIVKSLEATNKEIESAENHNLAFMNAKIDFRVAYKHYLTTERKITKHQENWLDLANKALQAIQSGIKKLEQVNQEKMSNVHKHMRNKKPNKKTAQNNQIESTKQQKQMTYLLKKITENPNVFYEKIRENFKKNAEQKISFITKLLDQNPNLTEQQKTKLEKQKGDLEKEIQDHNNDINKIKTLIPNTERILSGEKQKNGILATLLLIWHLHESKVLKHNRLSLINIMYQNILKNNTDQDVNLGVICKDDTGEMIFEKILSQVITQKPENIFKISSQIYKEFEKAKPISTEIQEHIEHLIKINMLKHEESQKNHDDFQNGLNFLSMNIFFIEQAIKTNNINHLKEQQQQAKEFFSRETTSIIELAKKVNSNSETYVVPALKDLNKIFEDNPEAYFCPSEETLETLTQAENTVAKAKERLNTTSVDSEALRKAQEKHNTCTKNALECIKDQVLFPHRFSVFSTKHLKNSEINLNQRLDENAQLQAASAYYNTETLLIALNDISVFSQKNKGTNKKEFIVPHQEAVGLCVLRNPVDEAGQKLDQERQIIECNASMVRLAKDGSVAHIYPIYQKQNEALPDWHNAKASTSQDSSGSGTNNSPPTHPALTANLSTQKAGGKPKLLRKK